MGYWIAAALLIVFGVVTGFSIGAPFLLLGLVMLIVGPVRQRARLFWPAIAAVPAFVLGFLLVAPGYCTAGGSVGNVGTFGPGASIAFGDPAHSGDPTNIPGTTGVPDTVTCTSLLGGPYAGPELYHPPLEPALRAGLAAAAGAAALAFALLSLARRRRTSSP